MKHIKCFVVIFLILPSIAMAMSKETQKLITVNNRTQFHMAVTPRTWAPKTADQSYAIPQNDYTIYIDPYDQGTVKAFPSGTKKIALFFLSIKTKPPMLISKPPMPVSTDLHSNTITIGLVGTQLFCNKTKSRHRPTPEVTFTRELIDK